MKRAITFMKLVIFAVSIAWAAYATWMLLAVSRIFHAAGKDIGHSSPNLVNMLAVAQTCAVMYGPAVVSLILLLLRWPENKLKDRS